MTAALPGARDLTTVEEMDMGYAAPRTAAETALTAIWAEVFWAERIGVDDNFFELGGDSILALRIAARIRAALGIEVDPRMLFEMQTIAACAEVVEQRLIAEVEAMSEDELERLTGELADGDQ